MSNTETHWLVQKVLDGECVWNYHASYEPILKAAAERGEIVWLGAIAGELGTIGFWSRERAAEKIENIRYQNEKWRRFTVEDGYIDGDRHDYIANQAACVAVLADLALLN
jgi:hypothetical protein